MSSRIGDNFSIITSANNNLYLCSNRKNYIFRIYSLYLNSWRIIGFYQKRTLKNTYCPVFKSATSLHISSGVFPVNRECISIKFDTPGRFSGS